MEALRCRVSGLTVYMEWRDNTSRASKKKSSNPALVIVLLGMGERGFYGIGQTTGMSPLNHLRASGKAAQTGHDATCITGRGSMMNAALPLSAPVGLWLSCGRCSPWPLHTSSLKPGLSGLQPSTHFWCKAVPPQGPNAMLREI